MTTKPSNPKDVIGSSKAPLSCVPMNVVAELGVAMLEGAAKYGRHNYRAVGVRSSVYFDAAMRHLIAWWEGEDIDPDSGMPHVTKAIATLTVLRDAQKNGLEQDDRPPAGCVDYPALNVKAEDILQRHEEKAPHHYTRTDVIEQPWSDPQESLSEAARRVYRQVARDIAERDGGGLHG